MNHTRIPSVRTLFAATALALSCTACMDRTDTEAGKRRVDETVDQTTKAATAAGNKAAELADIARDKTRAYLTSPQVKRDAAALKNALTNVGGAAVSATDDAAITASVSRALANDPALGAARVDIETRGGAVRLAGAAPSASAKARAGEVAKSVKGVTTVDNEIAVKAM